MLFLVALLGFGSSTFAQIQIGDDLSEINYARPQKYEIGGVPEDQAKEALRLAIHKLPCKCRIASKADLEGGDK